VLPQTGIHASHLPPSHRPETQFFKGFSRGESGGQDLRTGGEGGIRGKREIPSKYHLQKSTLTPLRRSNHFRQAGRSPISEPGKSDVSHRAYENIVVLAQVSDLRIRKPFSGQRCQQLKPIVLQMCCIDAARQTFDRELVPDHERPLRARSRRSNVGSLLSSSGSSCR
jgi:hypothetical protein